jgi:predicted ester cyclase
MGTERQVMQGYLDALVQRADFPAYFADDVVASFEGTDQTAVGRDRAGQLIRYVHENAFDSRAELKNLLLDEGKAAIEADFVGTHTGEFAGIRPTGRAVRVPYSVVYDLRGDKISGLRIYFPMSLLIEFASVPGPSRLTLEPESSRARSLQQAYTFSRTT